ITSIKFSVKKTKTVVRENSGQQLWHNLLLQYLTLRVVNRDHFYAKLKKNIQDLIREKCADILSGPNIIRVEIPTDWILLDNAKTFSNRLELDVSISKISIEADGAALFKWNKIV